ncbi:hypothetical protein FDP41_011363 [Naegleria fowleri]|uniref:Uncharacterized protein n=1 Tax=Naegleria fowleri TaxID=5763 RepID=A0A6A5BWG7_NAEFO|nr:uncharacterized protein FDP41_011363 [Naegleria fowleri]KAF0982433.1 hypothetical protein FDP41_011363 [Naegleria fowleri]
MSFGSQTKERPVTSLRFYVPLQPIDFDSYEDPRASAFQTCVVNFEELMAKTKKVLGIKKKKPNNDKKVIDDSEDEVVASSEAKVGATGSKDQTNGVEDSVTKSSQPKMKPNEADGEDITKPPTIDDDSEEEVVFASEESISEEEDTVEKTRKRLKKNTLLEEKLKQVAFGDEEGRRRIAEDLDWLDDSGAPYSKLNSVIHSITQRERMLKNQLTIHEQHRKISLESSKKKKAEKERKKRDDEYDSDDSWIDDTEYDLMTDIPMLPPSEYQTITPSSTLKKKGDKKKIEDDEEGSSEDSGGEESLSEDDYANKKFPEDIEKAIQELQDLAVEKGFDSSKTYKTIPSELNEGLKKLAMERMKHYKKGVPNTLLRRLRKIPPLNFGPKTIKERMKALVQEYEAGQHPVEIQTLKDKLKKSLFKDMLDCLERKGQKETHPYSDENYEILRKKVRDLEGGRLKNSSETNELMTTIIRKILKTSGDQSSKKKGEEDDKKKEVDSFVKGFLKSIWPTKTDLMKKVRSLCPELEPKTATSSSSSSATSSSTSSKPSDTTETSKVTSEEKQQEKTTSIEKKRKEGKEGQKERQVEERKQR